MRRFLTFLFPAIFVAAAAFAQAPPAASPEKGLWEISINGELAGTEEFEITPLPGGGWRHRSALKLKSGGSEGTAASDLQLNAGGFPLEYVVELRNMEVARQAVSCRFEEDGLYMLADFGEEGPPSDQSMRYTSRPRLLDHNHYSHYRYLLNWKTLRAEPRQEFQVFVPQSFYMAASPAEYLGVRETSWMGAPIRLHAAHLFIGRSVGVVLYYDGAGEPARVEVPSQNAVGERVDREPVPLPAAEAAEAMPRAVEAEPPMREEIARFQSGALSMEGTLGLPFVPKAGKKEKGEKYPAVLLLSDSGGQDRDGNVPGGPSQAGFMRHLAAHLAAAGWASLRYDERGIGKSGGEMAQAGLNDLISDARAALAWLRRRPDVDAGRIAIIGHGEGGLIALTLAAEGQPGLSALVLMNTPSASLRKVMEEQLDLLTEKDVRDFTRQSQQELFRMVEAGGDQGTFGGKFINLKWYREHFAADPVALARKARLPVLLLHGGRDRQVRAEHALYLRAALDEALAATTLRVFPDLDHLMLPSRGGTLAEYGDLGRRYGAEPATTIVKWLEGKQDGVEK